MYSALWRILPGPVWVRILAIVVIAAIVLFACVTWVFPWIDGLLGAQEGTVGQ
jgi:hypothetical protein